MPIDTSIYGNLLQRKSVADYQQQYDAQDLRKQALQQNALALAEGRQKQDAYGRSVRDQETVRNALMGLGAGATNEQRINALRGTGLPLGFTQADSLVKSDLEQQKTAAQIAKDRADIAAKNGALFKQYSGILMQSPTQQTAQALIAHYEQQTGEKMDNIRAIIQQAGDNPQALQKIGAALSVEAEKLLPKNEVRNLGGTDQAISTDFLGNVTPGQSFAKTATPDAKLQANTAGARLAFDREKLQEDKRQFDTPKPSPTAATNTSKITDANEAIAIINQAEPLLQSSTGSYGGVAIDKVAQFFGASTPGSISAQQLKALEGALVAKMPKMSGPQSDKDVALYRQMAAVIGDDTIPYQQKAAALETVREIQERYAGLVPGSSKPAKPANPNAPKPAQDGGTVDWGSLK